MQIGLRSDMNANYAAHRADIHALNSRVDALRAETRAEINDLDSRIDALTVEAAESNVRIENIARSLPEYASVDERLDEIERELARLSELVNALTNSE